MRYIYNCVDKYKIGVFGYSTIFFRDLWTAIKSPFIKVADWFKDIFSKAWQAVKDVFSTGGKIFLTVSKRV